jgi:hypothetical protein
VTFAEVRFPVLPTVAAVPDRSLFAETRYYFSAVHRRMLRTCLEEGKPWELFVNKRYASLADLSPYSLRVPRRTASLLPLPNGSRGSTKAG